MTVYLRYFGLEEAPFTITPDPRYLYLSRRHQEGLAHLLYGVGQGGSGGFVQLTGEVGTGKTTLCRSLLEQVPEKTRLALILTPTLTPWELLAAICDELSVDYDKAASIKMLVDALTAYLLRSHAEGERVVVVIDEAQNMDRDALEQVRLLTNLETETDKLMQIVLLGQPELRELLARNELRQLAQRITARYHLEPLDRDETAAYVRHRLAVAGAPRCPFNRAGLKAIFLHSQGVPRLINIIADRALMGAYARERTQIGATLVRQAAREVKGEGRRGQRSWRPWIALGLLAATAVSVTVIWRQQHGLENAQQVEPATALAAASMALPLADPEGMWRHYASLWRGHADQLLMACQNGAEGAFLCLRQSGNWQRIRRLGLPVMLLLQDGSELLLMGIGGTQVRVHDGREALDLPRSLVDEQWLGEYWVAAPGRAGTLQVGESDPDIRRLKAQAAALPDMPYAGPLDERFDPGLSHWVRAFQVRRGLTPDGIIGPATRLYMTAAAVKEPHLVEEW